MDKAKDIDPVDSYEQLDGGGQLVYYKSGRVDLECEAGTEIAQILTQLKSRGYCRMGHAREEKGPARKISYRLRPVADRHATDTAIQDGTAGLHLRACRRCQLKAEHYRALVLALAENPVDSAAT